MSILEKTKRGFHWVREKFKKYPRLTLALTATLILGVAASIALPFIGITALSIGVAVATCAVAGPLLGAIGGSWLSRREKRVRPHPGPRNQPRATVVQPPIRKIKEPRPRLKPTLIQSLMGVESKQAATDQPAREERSLLEVVPKMLRQDIVSPLAD